MVEEGRGPDDPIVRAVLAEYLGPVRQAGVGTVVLGCTHYPLLKAAVADCLGPAVTLVDSAEAVAAEVAGCLARDGQLAHGDDGTVRCFVSDHPDRFREVGGRFLGEPVASVSLVSPDEFLATEPARANAAEATP